MKRVIVCSAILATLNLSAPHRVSAQQTAGQVVSADALRRAILDQSDERRDNIREVVHLLRSDGVRLHVDRLGGLARVEHAVSALDDQTLRTLAAESRAANDALRGGLNSTQVIYVVVLSILILLLLHTLAEAAALS